MQIAPDILARHIERAAAEHLAAEYRDKGYDVEVEAPADGFRADLIARRGDELVVFEIKTERWSDAQIKHVQQRRNYVIHQL